MARVTTEDCTDKIPNRFDLVMLAAQRSRELSSGKGLPQIEIDNDKNPVLALREIASETQTGDALKERAIINYQTQVVEEEEEDFSEMDTAAMMNKFPNNVFKEQEGKPEAEIIRELLKQ